MEFKRLEASAFAMKMVRKSLMENTFNWEGTIKVDFDFPTKVYNVTILGFCLQIYKRCSIYGNYPISNCMKFLNISVQSL